ncbi:hypothetical protein LUZ60_003367 [Juncus effusus]|nr:hypothetical protein LUZ60_003367 [Juncus effusus]
MANRAAMERSQSSDSPVVSIECVGGSSKAEEWGPEIVQTGDVVEEIRINGAPVVRAPFKGGKAAVQKMLHAAFKRGDTSIQVRVRRGAAAAERERKDLTGCVVPSGKKSYVVRSIHDPNYMVGFADRTESECLDVQKSRSTRAISALTKSHVHDGFIKYPWEDKKMKACSLPNYKMVLDGASFLSILILPKALDSNNTSHYDTFDETMGRAYAWLHSSRRSGVPISFANLQTEGLLTKISGEMASATVNNINDLQDIINLSLYGFEDYHGVDLGVVKAIRLWYRPVGGEIPIQINLHPNDNRLGFAVSRNDEGFIYISSVEEESIQGDEAPSTRCGLKDLYKRAKSASKLLIISRISHEKVLPWMVAPDGSIRCFDTISLSQKLSLFRQALVPFSIHVLLWDRHVNGGGNRRGGQQQQVLVGTTSEAEAPERVSSEERDSVSSNNNVVIGDEVVNVERESIGDVSFRFDDVLLPSSWV